MTKTLNQIFFFLHQNQNIFLEKKNITPLPRKLNGPSFNSDKILQSKKQPYIFFLTGVN